jgi:type II secretory pathway pseudopilin PulG
MLAQVEKSMKNFLVLAIAAAMLLPGALHAAQTAQARMFCLSLRFQPGQSAAGSTLELSTYDAVSNGELAPNFDPSVDISHVSLFQLNDSSGFGPISGILYVNVPFSEDVNDNGFADFFEVSQAVSASTLGVFQTAGGNGNIQVTWSRAAGSKDGTCTLRMVLGGLGEIGTFTHAFELIEYSGPLTYTPGSNTVTASVELTQSGNSSNTFSGPMQFLKSSTNRFNLLELQPGTWTNAAAQPLPFTNDEYLHDTFAPTNYYGYFDFDDGDLTTVERDYDVWLLSIDDLNDRDSDRIPDFSDDPPSSNVRLPALKLKLETTNLLFSISGEIGKAHELQQATSLTVPDWQPVSTVTLTNDPQIVTVPLPARGMGFWRARAL